MRRRVLAEDLRAQERKKVLCRCGKPADPLYSDTHKDRCENCWADDNANIFSTVYEEKGENRQNHAPEAIYELGLPLCVTNRLESAGIIAVSDLLVKTRDQLLTIRHLGQGALGHIIIKLAERGLRLRGG